LSSAPSTLLEAIGHWLGVYPDSDLQLAVLAEQGLPTEVVRTLSSRGLSPSEVHSLVIPQRTLKDRLSRKENLSRDESDRAIRAARVLALSERVLGSKERALRWMREPKRRFEGRTPLDLSGTAAGAQLVEQMLIQIDEGMFACGQRDQ
jgi:putative toxin-antitoxin system antitoxin component (TIGR02293 family)